MPIITIPENKEFWCDNGCGAGFDLGSELLTQMSSPDDRYLMLVCPSCVSDESLKNWVVDFANDPR